MSQVLRSLLACLVAVSFAYGQKVATPFSFQFENKTLHGLVEQSPDKKATAMVILIPGYGKTNFVEGNWYSGLRDQLVASGLAVCFWDKMGCGKSEGEFNPQQPVENSAKEALEAIQEIQRLQLPGHEEIGFWGISRAGWIVPLINKQFPMAFWISVSGTDDKENFGYLLKSNLIIAGKPEAEAEKLFQAWSEGHKLFCTGADYDSSLAAIQPLRQDSISRKLFGYTNTATTEADRKKYIAEQRTYTNKGYFDAISGLWVYIPDFAKTLAQINSPVLALFGANDSQVDWRKTKALYEATIGKNSHAELTTYVFGNCNHNLQKCVSCAYQEDLSALGWQACDGYYTTMERWLQERGIVE